MSKKLGQDPQQGAPELYLESGTAATVSDFENSGLLSASGNKTVISVQVTNSANLVNTGSVALRIVVRGGLDGLSWVDVITEEIAGTDITAGAPDYFQEITNSGWSYPYAQVAVTLIASGSGVTAALLSIALAFSKQS